MLKLSSYELNSSFFAQRNRLHRGGHDGGGDEAGHVGPVGVGGGVGAVVVVQPEEGGQAGPACKG